MELSKLSAQYYWQVASTFVIGFMFFTLMCGPILNDTDVPWHLATGAWLLEHGKIPATDPWSFVSGAAPWYNLSWLWDVVLGLVERAGGQLGVVLFAAFVGASCLAFLAAQLLARDIHPSAVTLTLMAACLCLVDFITARPQLSGYAFVLVFHAILHQSRSQQKYGALLVLPALMLVWANMHGSFIAGFTLLGAYGIEAIFTRQYKWLVRLVAISVACVGFSLINPYGPEVAIGALRTLNGAASAYIIEWLPFTFSTSLGVSLWLLLFILAGNIRTPGIALADKILAVAWLVATLFIMRNGAIFMLLSAPYLAHCLDAATRDLRQVRTPSLLLHIAQRQSASKLCAASATIALLFSAGLYASPHEGRIQTPERSARDAIDYALANHPKEKYLTDFNLGGEVIYRAGGKLAMFMDSRAGTAYSEQAMLDYLDFIWLHEGWEQKMADYGVTGIIVQQGTPFTKAYENGLYRDRWQLVFAGKMASVYIARP